MIIATPSKFSNYKEVLQAIKQSGEKPTLEMFYGRLGVVTNDFKGPFNAKKTWALDIKKDYDKVRKHWEKYGGKDDKAAKKALKLLQKKKEQPTITEVCRIADIPEKQLRIQTFTWTKKLYDEITKANQAYLEGTNNANYDKCLDAIKEVVKENKFPLSRAVALKAGLHKDLLQKNIFPWKENVIQAIKDTYKNYIKIAPLYLNVDLLIGLVVSQKNMDFYRIGINFNEVDIQYPLAHIMYTDHLIEKGNAHKKTNIYVKKKSFNHNLSHLIKGIIMSCEGVAQKTITHTNTFRNIVKAAIWIGDRPSSNIEDAKKLFVDFSQPLQHMLKSGEMTHSQASPRQKGLIKLLCGMFACDEEKITENNKILLIPQMAPASNAYSNAARFSQQELEYAFSFYYHLFKQLAEVILENRPLPHTIKLPAGNALVLGVGDTLIVTDKTEKGSLVIDYSDGHLLSVEEIEALAIKKSKKQKSPLIAIRAGLLRQRKMHQKELSEINTNKLHPKRLQLGKKALDAWFMCMLFFTAMNDSTLGNLEWGEDDDLELEPNERKEFYNIKPRAQYKAVRFPLPKACLEDFKQFLSFRRFVLNGHPMQYLFFKGYGKNSRHPKTMKKGRISADIKNQMKEAIDSNLPEVVSGDSRVDHSHDALKNYGIKVTLNILQNKENTLIKFYNGQTAEEMAQDLSGFIVSMHKNVISDNPITDTENTATGGCEVEGKKEPEAIEGSPVEAKCEDQRSCIFCTYFKTFPEPESVRKLISLKYIIENKAYDNAPSDEYYEKEMGPWLDRIDALLNHMKAVEKKADQMIEQITDEVFSDGLLSPYWLLLSEFYEDTGMFE